MSNFALGAAAGGMAEGLDEILKRRFLEQIERQRAAEVLAKLQQDDRQFGMTHGLQRERLGEDARQFDTTAGFKEREIGLKDREVGLEEKAQPVRLAHTQAQTGEILRQPQAEADARAFTSTRDKTQHGYNLAEIGEQGQNALRVANVRHGETGPSGPSPQEAYADERTTRIVQSVDELEKKVSPFVVGVGSILSYFPGTAATDFESEVESLKANIAFGELVEMRNASKTGGALGNVSDRESQLLSATLGALNTRQSPANFKAQLQKIRGSLDRWQAAKAQHAVGPVRPDGGKDTDPLGIRK